MAYENQNAFFNFSSGMQQAFCWAKANTNFDGRCLRLAIISVRVRSIQKWLLSLPLHLKTGIGSVAMLSFDAESNNVCSKNKTFQGAFTGRLSNHPCTQLGGESWKAILLKVR